jgi:hypothetical protein
MDTTSELSIRNALTKSQRQHGEQRRTIGDHERNLINGFFARLRVIYLTKYAQAFPDEESVKFAKREWAQQITAYTHEELNIKLERLKNGLINVEPYCWPNIGSILAIPLKDTLSPTGFNSGAYLPADEVLERLLPPKLDSDDAKSRRTETGNAALEAMRSLLSGSTDNDDEPQWKKTWRARELAREKSGISLEREQQLLDEHFAEMNFGEFRNEADKAAKVAKYRDLHDEKMERMKAASLEFLASVRR